MTPAQRRSRDAAATLAAAARVLRDEFPVASAAHRSARNLDHYAELLRREVSDQ